MKIFLKILFLFIAMSLISCEDDPLLDPNTETEDKGSYAKLSLPNSEKSSKKKNPTIY